MTTNDQSLFPELNFEIFQNLIKKWFRNFPAIKIITLHRFQSKYEKYLRGNINTRYAVTFFLFDDVDPAIRRKSWLCPALIVALEDALGCFETVQTPDERYRSFLLESYAPGLYGCEKNVPENFRNHWYFSVVGDDEELKFIPCDPCDPHWKFILEDMKPKDEFEEQEKPLSSSISDGSRIKDAKPFPCPRAKWNEVKITLVSEDKVYIKTPRGDGYFSFKELGLTDNRRSDDKLTGTGALFKLFAQHHGEIKPKRDGKYYAALPETAKRLNKQFQKLFGIKESIYRDHFKAEHGYVTEIFFSDRTKVHE